MTRTVEQLWMHDFLALLGVPRLTLRQVLERNEGDKARALREVLAAVVDDPARPLHTRKMAALKLVLLEPDLQRRWAWQHAAYEFELADLAARHMHEADIASANYKCAGCRKLSGTHVDIDHPDWLSDLPPLACQRLEKRKPCCIFFSPRLWTTHGLPRPVARRPSPKPHDTVDVGDSLGPVTDDHDSKAG
jgi:hypothetical protein